MPRKKKKFDPVLLDIIIPVYGRFDLLDMCLDAIPAACDDINYRVLLFDNDSPDKGNYYREIERENVYSHQSGENIGFPRACNRAAKKTSAPYILFLNSDVIMQPGSISKMVKRIESDPEIGVVGAFLLFPKNVSSAGIRSDQQVRPAGKVQHAGMTCNIRAEFIHQFIGWSEDNPKIEQMQGDVPAVTGASFLTRRDVWRGVGGFFEGYGMGTYEDLDYCLTVQELGYRIFMELEAKGYHYTGASSETYNAHFALQDNRQIFLQRWRGKLQQSDWRYW